MSVDSFINAIASGDKLEAEQAFAAEMQSRIADAMDAKRIEVGQSIYGTAEETVQTEEE